MKNKHSANELIAILDNILKSYVALPDDDEHAEEGLDIAEKMYAITDNLLSLAGEKGERALTNLFSDYIKEGNSSCFDILNNIVLELISSGQTEESIPYTLMWVGVNSFSDTGNSIDLEGYDTVIQNALFQGGITSSIDDAIVLKEALPTNIVEQISLSQVYYYTSNCLDNINNIHNFTLGVGVDKEKMLSEPVKNFYIPVFIKGIFDDVLENLAESLEIDQIFEEVSSTFFKDKTVIFIPPVLWDEATEKNAEDLLNQSKLVQMLAHIRAEDKKDTEISIVKLEGALDTYVFMYLGKDEGELNGFLILEKQTDYLSVLQEVVDFCTDTNYSFLNTYEKISNNAIQDLLNHSNSGGKISTETQKELLEIFSNAESIDTHEWYKILTYGATKSIH